MKNVPHILKYVGLAVGVASIVVMANRLAAEGQRGKVTFEDKGILIHPGTNISTSDEKAMNDVLKRYDKSLYKIQAYKDGKLQQTKGRLSDVFVDKATRSKFATATGGGWAIQIARISGQAKLDSPSTVHPPHSESQMKEVVERLRPILEKYSK